MKKLLSIFRRSPQPQGQPKPASKRQRPVWPETTPIDKSDPYWEFNNNCSVNGTQYRKAEVEPGVWHWVVDQGAMRAKGELAAHKSRLWGALQTRVLTDEEMAEVLRLGDSLNIQEMVSYNAADKAREFNDALVRQSILRTMPPPRRRTRTASSVGTAKP